MIHFNRRQLLQRAALLSVFAALPRSLQAAIVSRVPEPSGFDENSTAEEVTAGLDLSGRTYAITGANSGLGLETMRVLALRGAHVSGIARNQLKLLLGMSLHARAAPRTVTPACAAGRTRAERLAFNLRGGPKTRTVSDAILT